MAQSSRLVAFWLILATSLAADGEKAAEVEDLGGGRYRVGLVEFDAEKRTLTIPAQLNMKEEVVEYLLVTEKGKTHESLLSTKAEPARIHLAALLLGVKKLSTPILDGTIEWQGNGMVRRAAFSEILQVGAGGEAARTPFPKGSWTYLGSRETAQKAFAATVTGSIISLIDDPEALINSTAKTKDNDEVHFPNPDNLPPKVDMPVKIVLSFEGTIVERENAAGQGGVESKTEKKEE